jgi:hypothetical protein
MNNREQKRREARRYLGAAILLVCFCCVAAGGIGAIVWRPKFGPDTPKTLKEQRYDAVRSELYARLKEEGTELDGVFDFFPNEYFRQGRPGNQDVADEVWCFRYGYRAPFLPSPPDEGMAFLKDGDWKLYVHGGKDNHIWDDDIGQAKLVADCGTPGSSKGWIELTTPTPQFTP